MQHEQDSVGLWRGWIRLYQRTMGRVLYNLPVLANQRVRDDAFSAFLDGYAAALDINPYCYRVSHPRAADALWNDFVRISEDASNALSGKRSMKVHDE